MADWIRVRDRLPNELVNVLVFANNGRNCGHCIAYFLDGWWGGQRLDEIEPWIDLFYADGGRSRIESSEITHWMPLPEPPND
jgi:hypothetical protein